MDLDRQAIERRDFPIVRRGYDPAFVDAHLRALAAEFEALRRAPENEAVETSLAATASRQVQSILEAAESAAADIERETRERAREARESADRDAQSTREQAIAKASSHVAAVARVTATLLERVGAMDGELGSLTDSLRSSAGRFAADLAAVEAGMSELYDAAAGHPPAAALASSTAQAVPAGEPALPRPAPADGPPGPESHAGAVHPAPEGAALSPDGGTQLPVPAAATAPVPAPGREQLPGDPGAPAELDGARLIALNMALNGEPRAETERYLAENFQLPDQRRLVEEVYAAIEA